MGKDRKVCAFLRPTLGKVDPPGGDEGVDCSSYSQNHVGEEKLHREQKTKKKVLVGTEGVCVPLIEPAYILLGQDQHSSTSTPLVHFRLDKLVRVPAPPPLNASSALPSLLQSKVPPLTSMHFQMLPSVENQWAKVRSVQCTRHQVGKGNSNSKAELPLPGECSAQSRWLHQESRGRDDSRSHSPLVGSKVPASQM